MKTQRRGSSKFLGKLTSRLAQRRSDRREEEADQRWIPIDAPMDLTYDNPVAELGPGDLFGEMTCMSLYPRSATVRAETDCTMLEMLRNVLDIMQRNKTFRAQLDQSYRQRALDSHLRGVPLFAELTDEFIDSLRETVELVRLLARAGDLPAGRSRRQLLSGAHRLRESVASASGRRNGSRLSFARRLFRRNRLADGRRAHGHVHGARSRGARAHRRATISTA